MGERIVALRRHSLPILFLSLTLFLDLAQRPVLAVVAGLGIFTPAALPGIQQRR
jgi:hypothetical protein